jgi:hypothetical protein
MMINRTKEEISKKIEEISENSDDFIYEDWGWDEEECEEVQYTKIDEEAIQSTLKKFVKWLTDIT